MIWADLKTGDVLHYAGSSAASYLVLENVSYITSRDVAIKYLNLDNGHVIDDVRPGDVDLSLAIFTIERRQP